VQPETTTQVIIYFSALAPHCSFLISNLYHNSIWRIDMERKLIIFLIILTTFLAGFNGLVKFLATGPNVTKTTPLTIAEAESDSEPLVRPAPTKTPSGGGGATTNGGSWGG
jgi:hypothetical protein